MLNHSPFPTELEKIIKNYYLLDLNKIKIDNKTPEQLYPERNEVRMKTKMLSTKVFEMLHKDYLRGIDKYLSGDDFKETFESTFNDIDEKLKNDLIDTFKSYIRVQAATSKLEFKDYIFDDLLLTCSENKLTAKGCLSTDCTNVGGVSNTNTTDTAMFESILEKILGIVGKMFPKAIIKPDRKMLNYLIMDTYIHLLKLKKIPEEPQRIALYDYIENQYKQNNPEAKVKEEPHLKRINNKFNNVRNNLAPLIEIPLIGTYISDRKKYDKANSFKNNSYKLKADESVLISFFIETAKWNPYILYLRRRKVTTEKPIEKSKTDTTKEGESNLITKIQKSRIPMPVSATKKFFNLYLDFSTSLSKADDQKEILSNAVNNYCLKRFFDIENLIYICRKINELNTPVEKNLMLRIMSLCILIQDPYDKKTYIDNLFKILELDKGLELSYKTLLKRKKIIASIGDVNITEGDLLGNNLIVCRDSIMYTSTVLYPFITASFYVLANKMFGSNLLNACEKHIIDNKEIFLNVNFHHMEESAEQEIIELLNFLYETIRKNICIPEKYEKIKHMTSLSGTLKDYYKAEYLNIVFKTHLFDYNFRTPEDPASALVHTQDNVNKVLGYDLGSVYD